MNLNGVWQYQSGAEGDTLPTGRNLSSEICVPFPVESALSGVMEQHDRLWYRRTFSVPAAWRNRQLMLNFGAVDYEAEVFVNGQSAGVHRGGYEAFSIDITKYLTGSGPQELIVRVFDPTDKGGQPRGKQSLRPGGIMYTSSSGIWQTVWLEPVAQASIQSLRMVPDIDAKTIRIAVNATGTTPRSRAQIRIRDGARVVRTISVAPNVEVAIPIKNPKLWSPDSPFLYGVEVSLGQRRGVSDRVSSYFGMRKISVGNVAGAPRILLNNRAAFQIGPLDQGFWPDGLYTAPTDEALRYDLLMTKRMGFNMTRKHIKVEPARWYYHADRLGLLVWQDLSSPNSYTENTPPVDKAAFEKQLDTVIRQHWNSPSIVMWVLFNESQGRYDVRSLTNRIKTLDPSRLTNRNSGAGSDNDADSDVSDVDDLHSYPAPGAPVANAIQARVCGEYGGISYVLKGHTWKGDGWGYTTVPTPREMEDSYGEYSGILKNLRDQKGLSAAVYTQITDVEAEVNGLMSYDRIPKVDAAQISLANRFGYPQPTYLSLSATAEAGPQSWKYSFDTPPAGWANRDFDDSAWKSGLSVFGTPIPDGPRIATPWTSSDVYLRRTFNAGDLNAEQLSQLVLRYVHDDDFEVWINGISAYKSGGAVYRYENRAVSEAARRAIVPNGPNVLAVHGHNNFGDQHVDVGLLRRIPAKR